MIREFIDSLNVAPGHSIRMDCPECFGKNSFSVSNLNGQMLWYCFRASCEIKGRTDYAYKISDFLVDSERSHTFARAAFIERIGECIHNSSCSSFVNSIRLNSISLDPSVELKYDPAQNRLVFGLNWKGKNYGYIGRAIDRGVTPRTLVYWRDEGCPFFAPKGKHASSKALLVEDAISACFGSSICDAFGLLGTSIPDGTLSYFQEYTQLYVALDDDATGKALKLQKQLSVFKETKVIPIRADVKNMTAEQFAELRRYIEDGTGTT